jgi:hypothetical protein
MNHLTTIDAGFLKAEDADRRVSLAIGGLAVIEGPAPEQDVLVSQFAERIRACPRFGQRLRLPRSTSARPNGSMIPTSTSSGMCGLSRCRIPATTASCTGSSPM